MNRTDKCLGYPAVDDVYSPRYVERLKDVRVLDVGCGENFTYVLVCNPDEHLRSKPAEEFHQKYKSNMIQKFNALRKLRKTREKEAKLRQSNSQSSEIQSRPNLDNEVEEEKEAKGKTRLDSVEEPLHLPSSKSSGPGIKVFDFKEPYLKQGYLGKTTADSDSPKSDKEELNAKFGQFVQMTSEFLEDLSKDVSQVETLEILTSFSSPKHLLSNSRSVTGKS